MEPLKKRKIREALRQAFMGKNVVIVTPTQMRASHLAYEIENVLLDSKSVYSPYRILPQGRTVEVGKGQVRVVAPKKEFRGIRGLKPDVVILDEGDILKGASYGGEA